MLIPFLLIIIKIKRKFKLFINIELITFLIGFFIIIFSETTIKIYFNKYINKNLILI